MSQYQDLQTVIAALLDRFKTDVRMGQAATFATCRACGRSTVEFDDDTDPGDGLIPHERDCPYDVAYRVLMRHDARWVERPDLVEAVEAILERERAFGELSSVWRSRTARAILDAVEVRLRA